MIKMTPDDLILSARKAIKSGKWDEAGRLYKRVIRTLAKKQNCSPDLRESYLLVKAEYFYNRPYLPDRESLDEFKGRMFLAIRYLNECSKISRENTNHYIDIMNELVQLIIKQYGCVWFETEHHVAVSCPIQLKSDGLGSMGCSVGVTYKKMVCSICGLDILNEKCTHIENQIYDDERCSVIREGLQIKDISLVHRPKDPLCRPTSISYPKEIFLKKCGLDASRVDLEHKLMVKCTRCRDENIDSALITPELFFKIHGLNMSMDKPLIHSTKKLEKGAVYFESIVYTEGSDVELGSS